MNVEAHPLLPRVQRLALRGAAVGLLGLVIGFIFCRESFFRSYLFAYVFVVNLAAGALAFQMLSYLVRGDWGLVVRRLFAAIAGTLPLLALLFLPLLLGLDVLYPWARDSAAADPALVHKKPWLNVPFFLMRAGITFAIWGGLAWMLERWSRPPRGTPADRERARLLSGPGIGLYVLTATFASFDWVMSLEPHWFSTIYGLIFVVGQGLGALALAVVTVIALSDRPPLSQRLTDGHLHDLGNLLFAFVLLWAYVSFSQFLIIWYANIAEEVTWLKARISSGWFVIAVSLLVLHFFLPFFLLLSRTLKRRRSSLAKIALLILAMRLIENYWLVKPAWHHEPGTSPHWLDLAAPLAIGGIWVAFTAQRLGRHSLLVTAASEGDAHGA